MPDAALHAPRRALLAAFLFALAAPAAKSLLGSVSAPLLAALLYLGSGIALGAWSVARGRAAARPSRRAVGFLAGAVVSGGIVAPLLFVLGVSRLSASSVSLLLAL